MFTSDNSLLANIRLCTYPGAHPHPPPSHRALHNPLRRKFGGNSKYSERILIAKILRYADLNRIFVSGAKEVGRGWRREIPPVDSRGLSTRYSRVVGL